MQTIPMPEAHTAVPVTFAGMAVTLLESPVTFDRNTQVGRSACARTRSA